MSESVRTRTVQDTEKTVQHRSRSQSLAGQRCQCSPAGRMETHGFQLPLQHLLFRPLPDTAAKRRSSRRSPYEHIIILANTDEYGGGGIYNSYTLTTAHHPLFRPVVVHEFGHSFGGLADEYFYEEDVMNDTYPLDVEPWEQNITTRVDFAAKWQDMLPKGTPVPTLPSQSSEYPVGRRLFVQRRLPPRRQLPHAHQRISGVLSRLPACTQTND